MLKTQRFLTVLLGIALLMLGSASRAAAYAQSPMATLRRTNKTINALLRREAPEGSRRAQRLEDRLKQAVSDFLDFRELARQALGKHWDERTPTERDEFVSILRELIERSYIKQLRSNLGYKVEYRDEAIAGDTAQVVTSVQVKNDGRTEELTIEYKMRKANSGWMVYDVVTDDVSIVRNYRSQFNRIIQRQSYKALVQKMRQKLETI